MNLSFADLGLGGKACVGRGHLPSLGEQAAYRLPEEEGEMVSFLSQVEVGRVEGGLKEGLGITATERPKAVDITRLAGPEACPGQAGGG